MLEKKSFRLLGYPLPPYRSISSISSSVMYKFIGKKLLSFTNGHGLLSSSSSMFHLERHLLITMIRTIGLILIYYTFSIGITFYQKWFIKRFHYPLIVVVCHMIVKWCLAAGIRSVYRHMTGIQRITLPWSENIRRISLPGIASALDIGFSNWSFEFITISLYTMTKSTCIIFILAFALMFDLEKKRLSLVLVVSLISVGLFMFTYKSTQFQLNGFLLVLSASMLSGLRWTLSQKLMQRKESSLSHPIDMMYHIQPWMLLGLFPLAFFFEILPSVTEQIWVNSENSSTSSASSGTGYGWLFLDTSDLYRFGHLILIGSILAFLMEFSEYLLLTFTSSLTLSMAGIFKEIFTLYLAINFNGDQMSRTNFIGLLVCLTGIIIHVLLKALDSYSGPDVLLPSPATENTENEEIESKRLLDDDVIHFENHHSAAAAATIVAKNNLREETMFEAKAII